MGLLNNLRLGMRRAVISGQVARAHLNVLARGLRPSRMGQGTEDEVLANEFAHQALFVDAKYSADVKRDALIAAIYESGNPVAIEACMERLQMHFLNRADVARAMFDTLQELEIKDISW